MARSRPSLLRLIAASLLSACLVAPMSCADKNATGVMLIIDSEMLAGEKSELSEITLQGDRAGSNYPVGLGGVLTVGSAQSSDVPAITSFPVYVAFYDDPDVDPKPGDAPLTITVTATTLTDPPKQLRYKTIVKFAAGEFKTLPVHLRFSCVDSTPCSDQDNTAISTCVDGQCQKIVTIENNQLPPYTEDTVGKLFAGDACFKASTNDCFAHAHQLADLDAVTPSKDDKGDEKSCEFDIAVGKDDANPQNQLNIGVEWVESKGRYTVLDFDPLDTKSKGWNFRPSSVKGRLVVTLPDYICSNIRNESYPSSQDRVKGIVFDYQSGCDSKRDGVYVCSDTVKDTLIASIPTVACSVDSTKTTPQAFRDSACSACLTGASSAWAACRDDSGCEILAGCTLGCQNKGPAARAACRSACNSIPGCSQDSKDKAAAFLADSSAALSMCSTSCGISN